MQDVLTGTVVWFALDKGFGFLKRDDGKPDLFVHYTAIQCTGFKTLIEGQRVNFLVVQGKQGLEAAAVNILP